MRSRDSFSPSDSRLLSPSLPLSSPSLSLAMHLVPQQVSRLRTAPAWMLRETFQTSRTAGAGRREQRPRPGPRGHRMFPRRARPGCLSRSRLRRYVEGQWAGLGATTSAFELDTKLKTLDRGQGAGAGGPGPVGHLSRPTEVSATVSLGAGTERFQRRTVNRHRANREKPCKLHPQGQPEVPHGRQVQDLLLRQRHLRSGKRRRDSSVNDGARLIRYSIYTTYFTRNVTAGTPFAAVRCGVARRGAALRGVVRCGAVQCSAVW